MGKFTKKVPNCGSTNVHIQELESGSDLSELYDVYCRDCEWSGDISPDLPLVSKKGTKRLCINHYQSVQPKIQPLSRNFAKPQSRNLKIRLENPFS